MARESYHAGLRGRPHCDTIAARIEVVPTSPNTMTETGLIRNTLNLGRRLLAVPPDLPRGFTAADFNRFMREETFIYSPRYAKQRVVIHNGDMLRELARDHGRGIILPFLHYGSFFLIGGAVRHQLGITYSAIASRRNLRLELVTEEQKAFWEGVHARGEALYGNSMFYTDEPPNRLMRWLKTPGNTLGIVMDVREPGQAIEEHALTLLGKTVYMQTGPARVACLAQAPMVPTTIRYDAREKRHHLYFSAPVMPNDDPVGMTQAVLNALEPALIEAPEQQFYDICSTFSTPHSG